MLVEVTLGNLVGRATRQMYWPGPTILCLARVGQCRARGIGGHCAIGAGCGFDPRSDPLISC